MELVTFSQAGKALGLSQDQIRKWAADGKLPVKDEGFPQKVDLADVRRVFKKWERKPRAGKDWLVLRDVCKICGVSVEGIVAAWKQKRRLAAIGDVPKLGYDVRNACRSKSWVVCISPIHAQRLIGSYKKPPTSPAGWIPSKDGKWPFPERFPRMTRGKLMAARRRFFRMGSPLDEQTFTISTGGHIRDVIHYRLKQITDLNASIFGVSPPTDSDEAQAVATNGHATKGGTRDPLAVQRNDWLLKCRNQCLTDTEIVEKLRCVAPSKKWTIISNHRALRRLYKDWALFRQVTLQPRTPGRR